MGKIAGNTLWLIITSLFFTVGNAAQLHVYSHDGLPLEVAGVGEPFLVKCTIQYDDSAVQEPQMEGVHGITFQRTGFQMSTINGSTKATYTYLARARKKGTYTVGPLWYVQNGAEKATNTVTISVGNEQKIDTQKVNSEQKSDVFARLSVSKKRAYVGEKITYTIRFYYTDPTTEVEQLVRPQMHGFKLADQKQSYAGKERVKNKEYRFMEWSWGIYPTHVGELSLPAHRLQFTQAPDDHLSHMNMFFGRRAERKRLYTNAETIDIVPLPPYQGSVVGIGKFKQFKVSINPPIAKEGEAMVLSLALEGEGNLDDVNYTELHDMPSCFRAYPSKQFVTSDEENKTSTKTFEFIVQGLTPGDWEIPPQECSYFDVDAGGYKTLRTSPLSVNVSAATHTQLMNPVQSKPTPQKGEREVVVDDLYPLCTQWGAIDVERTIPFSWIILLSWLPLVGICIYFAIMHYGMKKRRQAPSRTMVFKRAEADLEAAHKAGDTAVVYAIFVQLVAAIRKRAPSDITHDYMATLIDEQQRKKWTVFIVAAAEYAFYTASVEDKAFFKEGAVWLKQLKEQL